MGESVIGNVFLIKSDNSIGDLKNQEFLTCRSVFGNVY